MKEYNASSYKGKQIIAMALRFEGKFLDDVYDHWSQKKHNAYESCHEMYMNTENHKNFRICSHNTAGFTISWTGIQDGESIIRYETKDNSYLVWMER